MQSRAISRTFLKVLLTLLSVILFKLIKLEKSVQDSNQDAFQIHNHAKYGLQYSGSYTVHPGFSQVFMGYDFFIEFYYHTCITSSFVIFSVYQENMNQVTGTGPYTFFQIGVNGDGYYFFQLTLVNNEVITQYREVTTSLTVKSGWNYVSFYLDEIYEYSYVTMYNRYEGMTMETSSTKPGYGYYHRKYETVLAGEYDETRVGWTAANSKLAIVFGCAITYDFSNYPTSVPDTTPYGLCMRGWIQYVEAEVAYGRDSYISYYDTDVEVQAEHNCVGNKFCNPNLSLRTNTIIYENLVIKDTQLFYWDSNLPNINNQIIDSAFTCAIGLTVGQSYNPFFQQNIGRITFNESNYFQCNVKRTNLNTYKSFLGQMFTMEAWFRFDPIDRRPDGFISQIFSFYDASAASYVLGFAASNTFLRIYLNQKIQDIHYLFNETTDYWHYVAVSYIRQHEHEGYIYVFLDNILLFETSMFDWFNYNYASNNYWIHIGRDFPGIVRKTKINARPYCLGTSLWINTVASSCINQGSYKCSFCDLDEVSGSKYNCFPTCDNFGYYFTAIGGCKKCFNSCRYCRDSSASTNCFLCNSTAQWTYDSNKGITNFNPQGGNTISCQCSGGTLISDSGNLCIPCDSSCLTCTSVGSSNCDSCGPGYFKMFQSSCVTSCPSSLYTEDTANHLCDITNPCIYHIERPHDRSKGCILGQYFDEKVQACTNCDSNCATCEVNSTHCTSCSCGSYLKIDSTCSVCDTLFSNSMLVTSKGSCVETCGDGLNYGFYQCDDGNKIDGDGCSANCQIENNYICRGGYMGKKDNCTYILTELKSVTVDSHNNILIEFTRPITMNSTSNSGLEITISTKDGSSKRLKWSIYPISNFSTSYLFILVELTDEIYGGGYYDNIVTVKYKGLEGSSRRLYQQTGQIYDENGYEIKAGTYSTSYFNINDPISEDDSNNAQLYGKITMGFIAATISFWLIISFVTEKTSLPCIFIFLTFQSVFYYSLQDMFLDQRTRLYFNHFRIFRVEHDRIKNYFIETKLFDISKINTYIINKDIYYIGEIFYNCFLVNNQLKVFILAAYFALLPIVTAFNFALIHCTKYRCAWFNRNFGSKFFFGGTFLFFILFALPFGFTSLLELQRGDKENLFQIYSLFLSLIVLIVLAVIWATIWAFVYFLFLRPFKSVTNNFLVIFLEIPQITFGAYGVIFASPDHSMRSYGSFFYKFRFGVKPDILQAKKIKKKPARRRPVVKPIELTQQEKRVLDVFYFLYLQKQQTTEPQRNEMKFRSRLRDDFNDTSKPVNIIPEFKDLQRKKIAEIDEEQKMKDAGMRKKLRDSEEFRDTSMGLYDEKKEKQVNLVNPQTKKKILVKKRRGQPKLLAKDDQDNLEVAVIPLPGANLQSQAVSKAPTRVGSKAQSKRDMTLPSFGRDNQDQNQDFE